MKESSGKMASGRLALILALSLLIVVALASCSGDSEEPTPASAIDEPMLEEREEQIAAEEATGDDPALTLADSFQRNVIAEEIPKPSTAAMDLKYKIDCRVFHTAVVDNGTLYVDCGDKDAIIALDAASGAELWRFTWNPEEEEFVSTPTPYNGTVYASSERYVYALDPRTGSVKWRYLHTQEPERGSGIMLPIFGVDESAAYIYSNGAIHAVDAATGAGTWSADLCSNEGLLMSNPVVAGDYLFVPASCVTGSSEEDYEMSSRITAFNKANGEVLWSIERNSEESMGMFGTSFLVHDGVLIGIDGSSLLADSFSTAPEVRQSSSVFAIDARTGEEKWVFMGMEESFGTGFAAANGMVYVGSEFDAEGADGRKHESYAVYAIDVDSGEERWKFEPDGDMESSIFVAGPVVLFSSSRVASSISDSDYAELCHTYGRDAETGEHRFELFNDLESGGTYMPPLKAVAGARMYFMNELDYETIFYRFSL